MVENESEEVKSEYKKMINGELYEAAKLNHLLMNCKEILYFIHYKQKIYNINYLKYLDIV